MNDNTLDAILHPLLEVLQARTSTPLDDDGTRTFSDEHENVFTTFSAADLDKFHDYFGEDADGHYHGNLHRSFNVGMKAFADKLNMRRVGAVVDGKPSWVWKRREIPNAEPPDQFSDDDGTPYARTFSDAEVETMAEACGVDAATFADRSHLVKKEVTTKNGHKVHRWVNPDAAKNAEERKTRSDAYKSAHEGRTPREHLEHGKAQAEPKRAEALKPAVPMPAFGPDSPPGPVVEKTSVTAPPFPTETGPSGFHKPGFFPGDPASLIGREHDPVSNVPLDSLTATQSKVQPERVKEAGDTAKAKGHMRPIVNVRKDGKDYIYDGHHRATSHKLAGETHIPARTYEYDEATKQYKPVATAPAQPASAEPKTALAPAPKPAKPAKPEKPAKADPAAVHAEFKAALADPEKMTAESAAGLVAKAKTLSAPELKKLVDGLGIGKGGSKDTKAQRQAKVEKHVANKVGGAKPAEAAKPVAPAAPPTPQPVPAKPATPTPAKPTAKAEVPAGHTVEADMGNGVVTAKDPKTGELTTHFPKGMPEQQADRLVSAIGSSMDDLRLIPEYEDGLVPVAMLAHYVKQDVPDATDADVIAALSQFNKTRALQGVALNETQKLTKDKSLHLGDGKNPAASALYERGAPMAFVQMPRTGMSGKDMVAEYEKNRPKTPSFAQDSLGHSHKESGPGGGQFVKKDSGGGGGSSDSGKPPTPQAAKAESMLPAKVQAPPAPTHGNDLPAGSRAAEVEKSLPPPAEIRSIVTDALSLDAPRVDDRLKAKEAREGKWDALCDTVSPILQKALAARGIKTKVVHGTYRLAPGATGWDGHVWLETPDGVVIDAALPQYHAAVGVGQVKVYPKRPGWYQEGDESVKPTESAPESLNKVAGAK